LYFWRVFLSRFSYRWSEWCIWYTVGFVSKLRNLFILSIFRNSVWFKSNFKYSKQLFREFSIFGHYFAWHFRTVYPIDANDIALESYRLAATFICWLFLRISYHLRAVLNMVIRISGFLDFVCTVFAIISKRRIGMKQMIYCLKDIQIVQLFCQGDVFKFCTN
jgi:hypothetical protein